MSTWWSMLMVPMGVIGILVVGRCRRWGWTFSMAANLCVAGYGVVIGEPVYVVQGLAMNGAYLWNHYYWRHLPWKVERPPSRKGKHAL